MNHEERWLTEIITSQKRALVLSVLFISLTVAIIPKGISFLRSESIFVTQEEQSQPPVEPYYNFKFAFVFITTGILLLFGVFYLWEYHTPSGVRHQLQNLQELMSATLETRRREYRLHLPDGPTVTVKYIPYRWTTKEFCGFQLYFSPLAAWSKATRQEALRGGFAVNQRNILSTNCSLEEFFPRTLLLYKTIQRISQFEHKAI